jgi:hypothetical protein
LEAVKVSETDLREIEERTERNGAMLNTDWAASTIRQIIRELRAHRRRAAQKPDLFDQLPE